MAEKKLLLSVEDFLMSTIKAAEQGAHVDLFSLVPVKRSHSVCAQGALMVRLILKVKEILRGFTLTTQYMGRLLS